MDEQIRQHRQALGDRLRQVGVELQTSLCGSGGSWFTGIAHIVGEDIPLLPEDCTVAVVNSALTTSSWGVILNDSINPPVQVSKDCPVLCTPGLIVQLGYLTQRSLSSTLAYGFNWPWCSEEILVLLHPGSTSRQRPLELLTAGSGLKTTFAQLQQAAAASAQCYSA